MAAKKDYRTILGYLGLFTSVVGVVTLLPALSLIFYPEELSHLKSFLIPSAISFLAGVPLELLLKSRKNQKLSLRDDTVIVIMTWTIASLVSAMPFMISGKLGFTQAVFESVSGWTTTGLSVVDLEGLEKAFILHRSLMQFFGGVGIVLILSSALSSTFGMRLYSAEGHSDMLLPNLLKSSRLIMEIYSGYVLAGILLYRAFGMPLFDALNTSMSALSTGGFGITPNSIADYNSFSIELVTMVLMLLGTTSFAAHMLLLSGRFKELLKVGEIRFLGFLLGIAIPLLGFVGLRGLYETAGESARAVVFQAVSAISTTGFSTVDFDSWNSFSNFSIVILMIVGGGVGSTSGGMKLYRVYIMFKSWIWDLKRSLLPKSAVTENHIFKPSGKHYLEESDVCDINRYGFIYIVLLFAGTSVIMAFGYSLEQALFEFASALGTVGLSMGVTSPDAPATVLWVEIVGMMLGRLEIYPVFIGLAKLLKDTARDFR